MTRTVLTNCRGVAATEDRAGIAIQARYKTACGTPDEQSEFAAAASRLFLAGETVTAEGIVTDCGDFTLCADRAGMAWWIPTHRLA